MARPVHAVESRAVTLTRADASAVDAASQLCDSLASLDAVADALFAGLRERGDSQRGAFEVRYGSGSAADELFLALGRLEALWARLHSARQRVDAIAALSQRARHAGCAQLTRSHLHVHASPRLRACSGCRATQRKAALWTAQCSSAPRCARAAWATRLAVVVRADWPRALAAARGRERRRGERDKAAAAPAAAACRRREPRRAQALPGSGSRRRICRKGARARFTRMRAA